MSYGLRVTSDTSSFNLTDMHPISCVLQKTVILHHGQRRHSEVLRFPELPDGVRLYGDTYTANFEPRNTLSLTFNGKNATWSCSYPSGRVSALFTVNIYADFSGVPDDGYGLAFNNRGVWSCFSSSRSPLVAAWRLDQNLGASNYNEWVTNVPYSERNSVFVSLDSFDAHFCYIDNVGGNCRVILRRRGGRWDDERVHAPRPANVKIVLFAPHTPRSTPYGIRFRKPDGTISWESSSTPQMPKGTIIQPYVRNTPPRENRDVNGVIQGANVPVPHNETPMFTTCLKYRVEGKIGRGSNYISRYYFVGFAYNKHGRFASLNPWHEQGADIRYGEPRQGSEGGFTVPYLYVSDYF